MLHEVHSLLLMPKQVKQLLWQQVDPLKIKGYIQDLQLVLNSPSHVKHSALQDKHILYFKYFPKLHDEH